MYKNFKFQQNRLINRKDEWCMYFVFSKWRLKIKIKKQEYVHRVYRVYICDFYNRSKMCQGGNKMKLEVK